MDLLPELKNPVIILEPSEELEFKDKFGHVTGVPLIVKNKNEHEIYFKVKSTASKFYSVRPSCGKIHPHGQIKVIIQPHDDSDASLKVIEEKRHRFMVQSAFVDYSNPMSAEVFWKKAENTELPTTVARLRSKVVRFKLQSSNNADNNHHVDKVHKFGLTEIIGNKTGEDAFESAKNKDNKGTTDEEQQFELTEIVTNNKNGDKHIDTKIKLETGEDAFEPTKNNDNKHPTDEEQQFKLTEIVTKNDDNSFGSNKVSNINNNNKEDKHVLLSPFNYYTSESANDTYGRYIAKVLDGLSHKNLVAMKKDIAELIAKYEQSNIDA